MNISIKNIIRNLFKSISVVIVLGFVIFLVVGAAYFFHNVTDLPDVNTLKTYQHSHATEVYSDEGKKIAEFTTERRYTVSFESIPRHVIQAFLAAEDSKFYEHKGIDLHGIGRAIFSNLLRAKYAQGGSTITQQVARALLLESKKKEITRKVREIILAWRMERSLSKRDILNLYLSEIYLGHGAYGIGAAARNYFGKNVENLSVAEGALLAGLPQRPNDWNPFHNPNRAKGRQLYVLKRMAEEGFLTLDESNKASEEVLRLKTVEDLNNTVAPYYTEYVRQHLMTKYGSEKILSEGYKVYTTVKVGAQKAAEKALDQGLREVDKRIGWRGVASHLDSQDKINNFLSVKHDEILDALNPTRLLPANASSVGLRKLEYDLSPYYAKQSSYYGETPLSEGKIYPAVILDINDAKKMSMLQVGKTKVFLPFSGMEWVKIDGVTLARVSQVFKVGDVVQVKVEKIEKKQETVWVSLEQEPEVQGALLSYDIQNGNVLAMVGGKDFQTSKFNCALQAKRQVGSTFKPLIYAAAIDKGFSPSSLVTDSPIVFKYEGKLDADALPEAPLENWKPHNYGNKFEGDIPLRLALIRSMNIPTVKILNEITVDYGIQYARSLGITSSLPRDLTIALGSWSSSLEEIMRAYAIFPRQGKPIKLVYIKKIEDSDGKILEDALAPVVSPSPSGDIAILNEGRVISPQTAYVMTDMLKAVIRDPQGTGRAAAFTQLPIAGKTGTSNDHRDAWFIGYNPYVMAGVWIGYEKDKPLDASETGGKAAAPIWARYMKSVIGDYPTADFSIPDDIAFAYVDRYTGRLANSQNSGRVRVAFKMGTVPNSSGENIQRVGEPGVRATATGNPADAPPTSPENNDETADFMRQGYQE